MSKATSTSAAARYWKSSLGWLSFFLSVWFIVSFGCGILFRDWIDAHFPAIGHAPFGFWMAQQGSIICFVVILISYSIVMNRLDERYKAQSKDQ